MMSMSIANRIRDARQRAGLTQFELAQRVGVSAMTPSRWETGANRPHRRQLLAVAAATGATLEELTQDDDAAAATSRAADILTAVLQAALRSASSEITRDRRRTHAPISVDRRAGDRRALSV